MKATMSPNSSLPCSTGRRQELPKILGIQPTRFHRRLSRLTRSAPPALEPNLYGKPRLVRPLPVERMHLKAEQVCVKNSN